MKKNSKLFKLKTDLKLGEANLENPKIKDNPILLSSLKKKIVSIRNEILKEVSKILENRYGELSEDIGWLSEKNGIILFHITDGGKADKECGLFSVNKSMVIFEPDCARDFEIENDLDLISFNRSPDYDTEYIDYAGNFILKGHLKGQIEERYKEDLFLIKTNFYISAGNLVLYSPSKYNCDEYERGEKEYNDGVLVKDIEEVEVEKKDILKITMKDKSIGYFDSSNFDWLI